MSTPPPAVVLAGVHGFGRHHLEALFRLVDEPAGPSPRPYLAGLCDPVPPDDLPEPLRTRVRGVPTADRLEPLLRDLPGTPVVVVATPLHTHVPLALTALEHGAAVLLEKPPASSQAGFDRLLDAARAACRPVQVGFQDLGSPALRLVRDLVRDGAVGEVAGVAATGAWTRDSAYYARSRWAGRRRLDGVDVVDGALTNPFAHAVAAALAVDGTTRAGDVAAVEVELYRANPIEADDTSCVRVRTGAGTTVVVAVTLAASEQFEPRVTVLGGCGRIEWRYKRGEVTVRPAGHGQDGVPAGDGPAAGGGDGPGAVRTFPPFPQPRLLANLLDHLADPRVPLLVPLADTGAFTAVLDAVRRAPDPLPVPPGLVVTQQVTGTDGRTAQRRTVPGVEALVREAGTSLRLFSELGTGWSVPGSRRPGVPA